MLDRILKNNRLLFLNLVLIFAVKGVFAYSAVYLYGLISDVPVYSGKEIIAETNNYRASLNLPSLKESVVLDVAAAEKLQDMIQNQYFAHFSPSGISPWYWFQVNKYNYTYAGENLAIGFLDAAGTVKAWINSPSHRQNLANPHYEEMGVAVSSSDIHGIQGNVAVQFFGTQAKQTASKPGLTFGLSRSEAQSRPTATPTFALKPTAISTPPVSYVPISAITTQIPPSPATAAPEQPAREQEQIAVNTNGNQAVQKAGRAINTALIVYTFLVAAASGAYWLLREKSKQMFLKTTINFAVFLLAVLIPLFNATYQAYIR